MNYKRKRSMPSYRRERKQNSKANRVKSYAYGRKIGNNIILRREFECEVRVLKQA